MRQSLGSHGKEPTGPVIVRAGLAAFPYLARLGEWETAAGLLEKSVQVDGSPDAIAATLPMARRIVQAIAGTDGEAPYMGLLARILLKAGHSAEAEGMLRAAIDSAAAREDFATASSASGDLINLLCVGSRAATALDVLGRKADYIRRAGHGPWVQLLDQTRRLQILNQLGRWDEVIPEFTRLHARMLTLPDPPEANDRSINVWNVRETLLDTGHTAALRLEQWQVCLDLNAEILRSKEARGAPALERDGMRFNDYGPLLRLQRHAEARALLEACLKTYQRENAIPQLARAYSALADLEANLGHHEAACRLAETGFRYHYISSSPDDVAISHLTTPITSGVPLPNRA